jgi:hypothetical protein
MDNYNVHVNNEYLKTSITKRVYIQDGVFLIIGVYIPY